MKPQFYIYKSREKMAFENQYVYILIFDDVKLKIFLKASDSIYAIR